MSRVIDEHRVYLADRPRLDAFRRAISSTVRPNDVVLDLASGTGILGFLACQAGAARVYGIEAEGIAGLSRRLAEQNGFADRYVVIRELSLRAELPERVDVVVTDQIGPLGFEAGLFEVMVDARRRFLKPGGRVIPSSVRIFAAPFSSPEMHEAVAFWNSRPANLDFSPAAVVAANTGYPVTIDDARARLGDAICISESPMPLSGDVRDIGGRGSTRALRRGQLDAMVAWFEATLADGVTITNSPLSAERINRRAVMLPVYPRIDLAEGDDIGIEMSILFRETLVTWTVTVHPAAGAAAIRRTGSTFRGMLISTEDVARTRPDARPQLSRAGEARKLTLQLVDGQRTVAQIESAVHEAFPDLFGEREAAVAFVSEVLSRYAR